jgi:hypothetical protein
MYFNMKSYLKNNHNHTAKYSCSLFYLFKVMVKTNFILDFLIG